MTLETNSCHQRATVLSLEPKKTPLLAYLHGLIIPNPYAPLMTNTMIVRHHSRVAFREIFHETAAFFPNLSTIGFKIVMQKQQRIIFCFELIKFEYISNESCTRKPTQRNMLFSEPQLRLPLSTPRRFS